VSADVRELIRTMSHANPAAHFFVPTVTYRLLFVLVILA